jgi:hypothetical protein
MHKDYSLHFWTIGDAPRTLHLQTTRLLKTLQDYCQHFMNTGYTSKLLATFSEHSLLQDCTPKYMLQYSSGLLATPQKHYSTSARLLAVHLEHLATPIDYWLHF